VIREIKTPQPYVGPRPFEPEHRDLFFGRDREIADILSLATAHRVLLVYAQSGAGKTSLINAGLIPAMQETGFEVLPVARVRGPQDTEVASIPNVYVFHTLTSWAGVESDQSSLADFLVLRPHPTGAEGLPSPRVAIFDQFEELFTSYPEHWPKREGFFEEIRDLLDADDLTRVVLVMREDHIAQLDPYTSILPDKVRARFRLELLRTEPALSAVTGPLADTTRKFQPGVAEELVDELMKVRTVTSSGETVQVPGEFVEPVQLQLVCETLWRDLPPDVTEISKDNLRSFGDVDQALSTFYERCIHKAARASRATQKQLRSWFETDLITPAGTRGIVFRDKTKTAGIPNASVDALESEHLIRAEWRSGARWYELTHDRLVEPIKQSNATWNDKSDTGWDRILNVIRALWVVGFPLFIAVALLWPDLFTDLFGGAADEPVFEVVGSGTLERAIDSVIVVTLSGGSQCSAPLAHLNRGGETDESVIVVRSEEDGDSCVISTLKPLEFDHEAGEAVELLRVAE